jgi:hypothetical protein
MFNEFSGSGTSRPVGNDVNPDFLLGFFHRREIFRVSFKRARVTQIMNLLNLAPDIQEEILFLPRTERGRDPIRERHIRPLAAILDWRKQRNLWREVKKG